MIRGPHDSGRTTIARLFEEFLKSEKWLDVTVDDLPPLPHDQKLDLIDRLHKNMENPVRIRVELFDSNDKPQTTDRPPTADRSTVGARGSMNRTGRY